MKIQEISENQFLLSNVSKDSYKTDIINFMKSLNHACHIETYNWKATTPMTFECIIEKD